MLRAKENRKSRSVIIFTVLPFREYMRNAEIAGLDIAGLDIVGLGMDTGQCPVLQF